MGFWPWTWGKGKSGEVEEHALTREQLDGELVEFYQIALKHFEDLNKAFGGRSDIAKLSQSFNRKYAQFTAKQRFFKEVGGKTYMLYRTLIGYIGPAYEATNLAVSAGKGLDVGLLSALKKVNRQLRSMAEDLAGEVKEVDEAAA